MDVDVLALTADGGNNDVGRVAASDITGVSSHDLHRPPRLVKPEYYLDENGEKKDSIIALPVELVKVLFRDEFKCPICLGTLDKTWTVAACLHRFCAECLHRSLRSDLGPKSHHECPSCRAKMASRRASKPDTNFDILIHQFTTNGRLVPVDSLVVANETPAASTASATAAEGKAAKEAMAIQDVLKFDDNLDLEHYRRVHREKVEQFKGQSQANKKRFYSSGESNYSSFPSSSSSSSSSISLSKKPRVPPQQLTTNLQADKINMEPTVNVSIFPCPKWKETDRPSFCGHMPINPALREDGLLMLKKPYLRVPPQLRIVDLKQFLKMKYLLSDDQLDCLQVIAHHQEKDGGDGALVLLVTILDDQLVLKDVASKFWDGLGEFTLFFRIMRTN